MVQHMHQDPSGSAPQMLDSTSNDNDGTSAGSMTSGDLVEGKAGQCLDFEGTNDNINFGSDASLDISDELLITTVVYPHTLALDAILDMAQEGTTIENYGILILNASGDLLFQWYNGGWQSCLRTNYFSASAWYHIMITYSGGTVELYKNGSHVAQYTGKAALLTDTSNVLKIARYQVGSQGYLDALVDETRISKGTSVRSAAWAKAEYNSLWDNLFTFGAEEELAGGMPLLLKANLKGNLQELAGGLM